MIWKTIWTKNQHTSPASLSTRQRFRNSLDALAALCVFIYRVGTARSSICRFCFYSGHLVYWRLLSMFRNSQTGAESLEVIDHFNEIGKQLASLVSAVYSHDRPQMGPGHFTHLAVTIYQHSLPVFRRLSVDMAEGFTTPRMNLLSKLVGNSGMNMHGFLSHAQYFWWVHPTRL